MTAKLIPISAYTRRAPVDRYAAVRAAKTEQLFREVNDHHGAMLERALEIAFAEDPDLTARTQESF